MIPMYICICNAITERQIRACAQSGARSMCDLESCLGVGTNCGRCRPAANEILADVRLDPALELSGAPA
jgi:bacterioferritin-associated ferredoxin